MSSTLRGANNPLSAKLRRREDAARREAQEIPTEEETQNPEAEQESPVEVSDAEKAALEKLTVVQLKERLKSVGASTAGKKADLITRLLEETL